VLELKNQEELSNRRGPPLPSESEPQPGAKVRAFRTPETDPSATLMNRAG